jgi:hypothetical protein
LSGSVNGDVDGAKPQCAEYSLRLAMPIVGAKALLAVKSKTWIFDWAMRWGHGQRGQALDDATEVSFHDAPSRFELKAPIDGTLTLSRRGARHHAGVPLRQQPFAGKAVFQGR